MLEKLFYIYLFPPFSASIAMSKSLPKKSCFNTVEVVLFVTESDDEECYKTIDEVDEELSEVDLPLSDGKNDDLTENGDSEEESEDQHNHGGAHGRPHFFYPRTQNRLVKDFDSALDESNYDLLPISSETEVTESKLKKHKNTIKKIFWTNQKPNFFGNQFQENVVSNHPEVKPEYGNYDTTDKTWSLFFDDCIIKHIVTCTNQCIREKFASMKIQNERTQKKVT